MSLRLKSRRLFPLAEAVAVAAAVLARVAAAAHDLAGATPLLPVGVVALGFSVALTFVGRYGVMRETDDFYFMRLS